ncbi:TetR/AcrR family transcriptional regulator [Kitasatospora viridis]|uniref:TetR family transcriptional regulator n=1 Tax=Kitasatospora viridis TaxID=281105 RepID=A0A561UGD0_9ACTN|nr:TetR/AcrR family transcriptional regulator [Kitasatospora viridis]TWF98408.1 TetR family transcriptional regulator [Kitasatospora viridis]
MTAAGTRGRPRSFDREAALGTATLLFWEHGYEATSIADLTAAMGIRPPSLYAAFGDKRALFHEVVARYAAGPGDFVRRALDEEPTVRRGIARLLHEAASEYATPGRPAGCLAISAATNCTDAAVRASLRRLRTAGTENLEQRIARAVATGEEPGSTDPAALARFVSAVLQGMSQQARDGATRQELELVARTAVLAWPTPQ